MKIKLPDHVMMQRRRTKAGERFDFFFRVRGARPEGWPERIRLPRDAALRTRDASPAELAAVTIDAKELNAKLSEGMQESGIEWGTLPWLMAEWRNSDDWKALRPKTQKHYLDGWKRIEPRDARAGRPHARSYTWANIHKLVTLFKEKPGAQRQVRQCLDQLLQRAENSALIEENPFHKRRRYRWQRNRRQAEKPVITYRELLEVMEVCCGSGRPSMALAAMIGFDTMQSPVDVIAMRFGAEYDAATGAFDLRRSKTGREAYPVASKALRALIGRPDRMFLVVSETTGQPYKLDNFRAVWRKALAGSRFDGLAFKWLRHSGHMEAKNAGLRDDAIDAIGGWKAGGAGKAVRDAHYTVLAPAMAAEGMAMRENFRVDH